MAIKCCYGCVAPKRHTACWAHCTEYAEEKAAHDKRKAELDKKRMIAQAIYGDRGNKVYKALKNHRKL